MAVEMNQGQREAIESYQFVGELVDVRPYGSGHINDTYLVTLKENDSEKKVILQRMNKSIFTKPVELMENVLGVTSCLRERIIENGGDPERETLNVIPTVEGNAYFVDSEGEYWRAYKFITGATSYDAVETPEDFYQSAVSVRKLSAYLWQNIRLKHFMKQSKASMTRKHVLPYSKKQWKKMSVVRQLYKKKLILFLHMKRWQMYLAICLQKGNFRFV